MYCLEYREMSDCPGMNHIGTQDTIPHKTRQNILHKPDKVSDFLGKKNCTVSFNSLNAPILARAFQK